MSMFHRNHNLTDSLTDIVSQLSKPIDQRLNVNNDTVSSYLNFAQISASSKSQILPVHSQPPAVSNDKQYKLQCSQTQPITRLYSKINDAPGAERLAHRNLNKDLQRVTGVLKKASFGRAAVRGQHFLIGTDDSEASHNFVLLMDGGVLSTSAVANPVVAAVQVPEHIRDIRWVAPSMAIAATGKGRIQLYSVNTAAATPTVQALQPLGAPITNVHTDYIRELAPHPLIGNVVASVGQDARLCVSDFSRLSESTGTVVQQCIQLSGSISSVRWPMYNQSVCVSATTDSGSYMMFDTRGGLTSPVVSAETHSLALPSHFTSHVMTDGGGSITNPSTSGASLYTHERYTDHHVLFGYSNGSIKHIDMRNTRAYVDVMQDPYVEGIGSIEYNCRSRSFLVSGYTDFTVWKHENDGSARVWSHAMNGTDHRINEDGYSCNATYFDDDTILVTDSNGTVSLRIQGFN